MLHGSALGNGCVSATSALLVEPEGIFARPGQDATTVLKLLIYHASLPTNSLHLCVAVVLPKSRQKYTSQKTKEVPE